MDAPTYASFPRYTLLPFPRQVRIETSSACSMACVTCSGHGDYVTMRRPKGRMSWETVQAILREIAAWLQHPKEIVPTNFGEWPLFPEWHEMGKLIEQILPKTMIALSTTATLFNDEKLQQLASLRSLRWINFSVNAYFGETYERFHQRPASLLPWVESRVRLFKQMRPDAHVVVSMVYSPEMQTELEKEMFEAHWKGVVNQVEITPASFAGHPTKRPLSPVVLPCRSVFDGLVVFSEGTCSISCCFNGNNEPELQIGHWPEEKLLDMWRGEKLKALADLHNRGRRTEIKHCLGCTYA